MATTTTTAKKTGRKTTTTKKTTVPVEEVKEEVVKEEAVEEVKAASKKVTYSGSDLVPCKSVTAGELLLPGKKSGILYRWGNYGDVTEVEYQDLMAIKSNKSRYLYEPWMIVDDEELLKTSFWKDLNDVYASFYDIEDDVERVFRLSNDEFEAKLRSMPKGIQKTVASIARDGIDNGTIDSLAKIRAIDNVLGTDLLTLIKE